MLRPRHDPVVSGRAQRITLANPMSKLMGLRTAPIGQGQPRPRRPFGPVLTAQRSSHIRTRVVCTILRRCHLLFRFRLKYRISHNLPTSSHRRQVLNLQVPAVTLAGPPSLPCHPAKPTESPTAFPSAVMECLELPISTPTLPWSVATNHDCPIQVIRFQTVPVSTY